MRRKRRKIWLLAFPIIIVAVGCGIWLKGRADNRREYEFLRDRTATILSMKNSLQEMLSGDYLENLSDFDAGKVEEFAKNVQNGLSAFDGLCDLGVYRNWPERGSDMRDACNAARQDFEKMQLVAKVAQAFGALATKINDNGALADEDFAEMKESEVAYLRDFATDFLDYRKKVAEFRQKYSNVDSIDELKMQEEYGVVSQRGVELTQKYVEADKEGLIYEITGISGTIFAQNMMDVKMMNDWAEEKL